MDEHWISFGSIMMVVIGGGISLVGGVILYFTFKHWDQEKSKKN